MTSTECDGTPSPRVGDRNDKSWHPQSCTYTLASGKNFTEFRKSAPLKSILKERSSYGEFDADASYASSRSGRCPSLKSKFSSLISSDEESCDPPREMRTTLNVAPPLGVPLSRNYSAFSDVTEREGSSKLLHRGVSFNSVVVREYDRTVGDNPSCMSGPPLTLDWSYSKVSDKSVDDYEMERADQRVVGIRSMYMSKYKRKKLLSSDWGCSEGEMKEARRMTKQVQLQRNITRVLLPIFRLNEILHNFKNPRQ